jgi:hypothetical protein
MIKPSTIVVYDDYILEETTYGIILSTGDVFGPLVKVQWLTFVKQSVTLYSYKEFISYIKHGTLTLLLDE